MSAYEAEPGSGDTENKSSASKTGFGKKLMNLLKVPGETSAQAFREWAKVIVPILALVVAIVAAIFAFYQLDLATVSAERQQRAYVMIEAAGVYDVEEGKRPFFKATIKNFGNTPAIDVMWFPLVSLGAYPRKPTTADFPQIQYKSNLPPSGERQEWGILDHLLTKDEVESLQKNTSAIYLDALITYTDVFKKSRRTIFKSIANGSSQMQNHTIGSSIEGDTLE